MISTMNPHVRPCIVAALLGVVATLCARAQVVDFEKARQPVVEIHDLWRFHTGDDPDGKLGWSQPGFMVIPVIAVAVLGLAMIPQMRWALMGADYSRRLYITIGAFAALALVNVIYAILRKAWATALASAVIALAWFFVGIVNSVV